MKKCLLLCLVTAFASLSFAQEMDGPKPSPASEKYAVYRHQDSTPTYGLAKIQAMVKKLKEDEDMNRRMADKDYKALSVQEKFTYIMIHGEDFSQNCDMMPAIIDEHKKIFSFFPGAFDDTAMWSDRQREFLKTNRAQVTKLIKATIVSKNRVGNNLKNAIGEMNAVELIPTLVTVYNRDKKDHDILTLLMILMKDGKYAPFLKSSQYKGLYGDENNYRSFLMATPETQRSVLKMATAYYHTKKW